MVDHAERFSRLMNGASLLYNLMLSEKAARMQAMEDSNWHERVAAYARKLDDWARETPPRLFEG